MYPREQRAHWVRIAPDSLLGRIVGNERLGVNSFHHMAVKQCAPGLKAVAWSEADGIIEAVERAEEDGRFFLAVQWHPEMMAGEDVLQKRILTAFVDSCRV